MYLQSYTISLLIVIIILLSFIIYKIYKTMATLAELQQAIVDLQTSLDTSQAKIIAEIQALKDQIAAGGAVTPADLDNLIASVNAIKTDIDTTDLG